MIFIFIFRHQHNHDLWNAIHSHRNRCLSSSLFSQEGPLFFPSYHPLKREGVALSGLIFIVKWLKLLRGTKGQRQSVRQTASDVQEMMAGETLAIQQNFNYCRQQHFSQTNLLHSGIYRHYWCWQSDRSVSDKTLQNKARRWMWITLPPLGKVVLTFVSLS